MKTYFCISQQNPKKKWYMIMTMKQSKNQTIEWSEEATDDGETSLNNKVPWKFLQKPVNPSNLKTRRGLFIHLDWQ